MPSGRISRDATGPPAGCSPRFCFGGSRCRGAVTRGSLGSRSGEFRRAANAGGFAGVFGSVGRSGTVAGKSGRFTADSARTSGESRRSISPTRTSRGCDSGASASGGNRPPVRGGLVQSRHSAQSRRGLSRLRASLPTSRLASSGARPGLVQPRQPVKGRWPGGCRGRCV